MRYHILPLAATLAILTTLAGCQGDTPSDIGSSLVTDEVSITRDSLFTVYGTSVPTTPLPTRTVLQLLGNIDAPGYGTLASSVVTQLMPAAAIDTAGVTAERIDSVKLVMRMPMAAFTGDTLATMGIRVDRLNKPLPFPIYSDFDPASYYDPQAEPLTQTLYSMVAADGKRSAYRNVTLPLPVSFGRELFEMYKQSAATVATPQAFAQWFPGMYIHTSFGGGRVAQVDSTVVEVFYRSVQPLPATDTQAARDTTLYHSATYLAVTPEILTNNNIRYSIDPALEQRAAAGEPLIVAPGGYDVRLQLPAEALASRYHDSGTPLTVVNTLTLTIPADYVDNDYGIAPPPYLLLVKTSEKERFFATSQLPDNKTSFYASYDAGRRCYTFTGMRNYMLDLIGRDALTEDDGDFTLCAVTVAFQAAYNTGYSYYYNTTTQVPMVVSGVTPYVNRPAMTRLLLDEAKLMLTYSTHNM